MNLCSKKYFEILSKYLITQNLDYFYELLTSSVHIFFLRHRFPRDERRRALWIKFVNIPNFMPPAKCYICSQHFPEDSFDRTSELKVQLKEDAVPSINVSRIKFVSIKHLKYLKKKKCGIVA